MKRVLLLLILLLVPIVNAGIEIERLKVYADDERKVTIEDIIDDKDCGIIEEVRRGSNININVKLLNNMDQDIDDILMKVTIEDIDNGNDFEKKLSEFTLRDGDEITKDITFTIPNDAKIDNYYMFLDIGGKAENDTDYGLSLEFELEVIKELTERNESWIEELNKTFQFAEKYVEEAKKRVEIEEALNRMVEAKEEWKNSSKKFEVDFLYYKEQYETLKINCDDMINECDIISKNMSSSKKRIENLEDSRILWSVVLFLIGCIITYVILRYQRPKSGEMDDYGREPE